MILAFLAALAAQPLPAPNAPINWELVVEDPSGRIEIDPGSISSERGMVRFVVRLVEDQPAADGSAVMVMRVLIDCPGRRVGYLGGAMYTADGRQLAARETPDVQLEPIEANSARDLYHRRVCGAPTT